MTGGRSNSSWTISLAELKLRALHRDQAGYCCLPCNTQMSYQTVRVSTVRYVAYLHVHAKCFTWNCGIIHISFYAYSLLKLLHLLYSDRIRPLVRLLINYLSIDIPCAISKIILVSSSIKTNTSFSYYLLKVYLCEEHKTINERILLSFCTIIFSTNPH